MVPSISCNSATLAGRWRSPAFITCTYLAHPPHRIWRRCMVFSDKRCPLAKCANWCATLPSPPGAHAKQGLTGSSCTRPTWRALCYQQNAQKLWLPDPNRDGEMEILEQFRRAGSSFHQAPHSTHVRFQSLRFRNRNTGRNRSGAYDPQRPTHARSLSVSSIRRTGRLTRKYGEIRSARKNRRNRT